MEGVLVRTAWLVLCGWRCRWSVRSIMLGWEDGRGDMGSVKGKTGGAVDDHRTQSLFY